MEIELGCIGAKGPPPPKDAVVVEGQEENRGCQRGDHVVTFHKTSRINAGLSPLGMPGVPRHPQILSHQLTLSQPGGQIMPPHYYWHPRIYRPFDSPVMDRMSTKNIITKTGLAKENSFWPHNAILWFLQGPKHLFPLFQKEKVTIDVL